jgi:hypothetical protein
MLTGDIVRSVRSRTQSMTCFVIFYDTMVAQTCPVVSAQCNKTELQAGLSERVLSALDVVAEGALYKNMLALCSKHTHRNSMDVCVALLAGGCGEKGILCSQGS